MFKSLVSGSLNVNQLVDALLSKAKEAILQLISSTFSGLVNPVNYFEQIKINWLISILDFEFALSLKT